MPEHFYRFIGKTLDKDGNTIDVPDAWLDVQRSERLVFVEGSGFDYLKSHLELKHYDETDNDPYRPEPNPVRKTKIVKIIPPDEDPDNPSLWFEIPGIEELTLRDDDQIRVRKFDNSTENDTRRSHVVIRRIFHYDTPYDDNPNLEQGGIIRTDEGVMVREYQKITDPDTKDSGQYLDVEIVKTYEFDEYLPEKKQATLFPRDYLQRALVRLDNQGLIDNSEEPATGYGREDVSPPWRLDPYQNIVNVQYAPSQIALLGRFTSFYPETATESSVDGDAWTLDDFGAGTSNAASGLGKTVVCAAMELIAFGRPRDGDPCFIAVKGKTVERGVLDDKRQLKWTNVATLDTDPDPGYSGGGRSCKFCGGAFFITYVPGGPTGSDDAYIAVSFDGVNFRQGIKPFNGVTGAALGTGINPGEVSPSPTIGSVAYDPDNERYVLTGTYERSYVGTYTPPPIAGVEQEEQTFGGGDHNFMSSISSDGLSWTPTFDRSEGAGDGGSVSSSTVWGTDERASTVAFGNGVFVAVSGYKVRYTDVESGPITGCLPACAVAVSSNGSSWTNRLLPGVPPTTADTHGTSEAVVFVKSRKVSDPENEGFFLVTGHQVGGGAGDKVWLSEDGLSWRQVQSSASQYGWILSVISVARGTVIFK